MKRLKYIFLFSIIVGLALAIYVFIQPNTYEVTRTRRIEASTPIVYNHVLDFKTWKSWSSWVEEDPGLEITFSENSKGISSKYSFKNDDGIGHIETIKTAPNKSIHQTMQFEDYPKSDITLDFKSNDDQSTDITWTIKGKDLPFGFKVYALLMGGMEKQIGPHYERSLEKLDSIIVSDIKKFNINIGGLTQHGGGYFIYNTTSCKISDLEVSIEKMLPEVINYATKNNIRIAGAPFINYHKWDEENNAAMFSCCIPTAEKVISSEPRILTGKLEPFKALKTTLKGHYSNLKETWETSMNYIEDNNMEFIGEGPMLEVYLTDPSTTPNPADWVTEIFIALK